MWWAPASQGTDLRASNLTAKGKRPGGGTKAMDYGAMRSTCTISFWFGFNRAIRQRLGLGVEKRAVAGRMGYDGRGHNPPIVDQVSTISAACAW